MDFTGTASQHTPFPAHKNQYKDRAPELSTPPIRTSMRSRTSPQAPHAPVDLEPYRTYSETCLFSRHVDHGPPGAVPNQDTETPETQ